MKYAVIIVTYNRLELLKECLQKTLVQTLPFQHIIVIDNASTDGTEEYLKSVALNNNTLSTVRMKHNLGGAGGFCRGVHEALKFDDDYLLFIDDDAIIDEHYIEEINAVIEKENENCKAFSGTVMTNGKINTLHRYLCPSNKYFTMIPVDESDYKAYTFEYDLATFCGLVLSYDVIRKIGIPDQDFFISYDDTEYCLRARKYTKYINVNHAVLNHKERITVPNAYNWKRYYGYRNKIIVGMQNTEYKRNYKIKMLCWHIVRIFKCAVRFILNENRSDQLLNMRQCYDAWKDGVVGKKGINSFYMPGTK